MVGPRRFAPTLPNQQLMNSEKAIVLEGTIMMVLPGTMFRVALANQRMVLAHISGKMRKRFIRLTIGDRVKMEMSPYDTAKARIVIDSNLWRPDSCSIHRDGPKQRPVLLSKACSCAVLQRRS